MKSKRIPLQNIPIHTPLGQQIRQAFVPRGTFINCNYSGLELRILAQMAAWKDRSGR